MKTHKHLGIKQVEWFDLFEGTFETKLINEINFFSDMSFKNLQMHLKYVSEQ